MTHGNESHAGSATYPKSGVYWAHPPNVGLTRIVSPPAVRFKKNNPLINNKKCWDMHTPTLTSEGNDLPV